MFRVSEEFLDTFGPDRVINTPLSESAIVGTAIGMAVYGLRPIAEIQFMGFTYRVLGQIFTHAARIRSRPRGMMPSSLFQDLKKKTCRQSAGSGRALKRSSSISAD